MITYLFWVLWWLYDWLRRALLIATKLKAAHYQGRLVQLAAT